MERQRAGATMHELLLDAVERAAAVQETSAALIEQQRDALTSLHETLDRVGHRRAAFRNGHPDAGKRSQLG